MPTLDQIKQLQKKLQRQNIADLSKSQQMDDLEQENERLKEFKERALRYAYKFVMKVEMGRARSVETYADMIDLLNSKEGE